MTDQLLATDSEFTDIWMAGALLSKLGTPEDFKAPAVFLLAPRSSIKTSADLRVDEGYCASAWNVNYNRAMSLVYLNAKTSYRGSATTWKCSCTQHT